MAVEQVTPKSGNASTLDALDSTDFILASARAAANGVASLDASTLIPTAQIPTITKAMVSDTGTWEVAEVPDLPASKITSGDIAADRLTNALKLPASNGYSDQSALGLTASRRPSTTRPTFVTFSVRVQCNEDVEGRIRVLCDSADPPTTLLMEPGFDLNNDAVGAPSVAAIVSGSFICPPNDYYRLTSVNTQGSPTFTLTALKELAL